MCGSVQEGARSILKDKSGQTQIALGGDQTAFIGSQRTWASWANWKQRLLLTVMSYWSQKGVLWLLRAGSGLASLGAERPNLERNSHPTLFYKRFHTYV